MNLSTLPSSAFAQMPSRIELEGDSCGTVSVFEVMIVINSYIEDL